jgi:hypothetical protein
MLKKSRIATVLASLAVASLAAPQAMARDRGWGGWGGWGGHHHRHRDRVSTGDVLAGILIIGGIAAVATAASNANKNKRRDRDDYRYPDNDYPQRERSSGGYANDDRNDRSDSRGGSDTAIDSAIDRCMDEVSRGSTKIDEVDSVNRDGDGWRVQGRTSSGGQFTCTIDGDGRIRNVNIDGRAV